VREPDHERYVGSDIATAAAAAAMYPGDFYLDLLVEDRLGSSCLIEVGNEENVRTVMTSSRHTAGSDGILVGSRPHPRGWGTFPRYLARYSRELGLLSLEECVRRMTSRPARRLGLPDRGVIAPGARADLTCFSAEEVRDTATYADPRRTPEGIPFVLVGGVFTVRDGTRTDALPGRSVRGPAARGG
jgi:N-acyl-D-amino-acid deacylase